MYIAILSVKLKLKSYVQIHKMPLQYWEPISKGLNLKPISERQLRDRLKKSAITLENPSHSLRIFKQMMDIALSECRTERGWAVES